KQPSLLVSDVMSTVAGKVSLLLLHLPRQNVLQMVSRDPRVLTRSFSVLLRLKYARLHFPESYLKLSPTTLFPMPLDKFLSRFPSYHEYLTHKLVTMDSRRRSLSQLQKLPLDVTMKA